MIINTNAIKTKNKLYIVCPKSKISKFVKEIGVYKNVVVHKERQLIIS